MLLCFAAGGGGAFVALDGARLLPAALAFPGKPAAVKPAPGKPAVPAAATAVAAADAPPEPLGADASSDGWAHPADKADAPPDIKALATLQLAVPARAPDCDTDLQAQVAPTGAPWPAQSGYVDGYPVGNEGDEMQIVVDNSNNPSAVLVKLYDLDRRSNVRHAYVQGRTKFLIDKLTAGKYEVRYQNILVGGTHGECVNGRRTALRQAQARPAGG
jgi:hypothetical protein